MKRKVIKQGNNTLTITLPKKWTTRYHVKAGDELDLYEKDRGLIIGEHKGVTEQKTELDVSGLDRSTILILLQGLTACCYKLCM